MLKPSFLTSEDGAVTVDWVVLTGAAAGVALATIGVLSAGLSDANDAVAAQMDSTDSTSDSWSVAMAKYQPFDTAFYGEMYNGFSILSDADLNQMERLVNDTVAVMAPLAETAEDNGMLNDLSFAIGRVYAERNTPRTGDTGADLQEINRIMTELGWDQQTMVGA